MGPTTAPPDAPPLPRFLDEARAFLDDTAPRREATEGFVWERGSDRVGLFDEVDEEEQARAVSVARAWRRHRFDAGFGWITGPPEEGGRGLPDAYERAYRSLERGYQVPSERLVIGPEVMAPALIAHAAPGQRRRWLAGLYRGDLIGCLLFSEPGAGSDLAGVATGAVPDGDLWLVNGQKVWTSGAHYADLGLLLARTDPGPRHANLTTFVLDMHAPGLEVRPLRQMTGGHAFNEVFLSDVAVPDADRVGDRGAGWRVAMTTLGNDRGSVGAPGGARILDPDRLVALVRATDRADDPVVRQELARVVSGLAAARYARLRVEAKRRAGLVPGPEWSTAKLAFTANLEAVTRFVTLALGARLVADGGGWGTYAWADFVLGVPGLRIAAGTDEILRTIVAERVLGLPRDP